MSKITKAREEARNRVLANFPEGPVSNHMTVSEANKSWPASYCKNPIKPWPQSYSTSSTMGKFPFSTTKVYKAPKPEKEPKPELKEPKPEFKEIEPKRKVSW